MKVMVNFAISADGKIGTWKGGSSKFTSRKDLERLWEIRKFADAIMVGRGTLEADNMSMTIPSEANPDIQPLRVIVSRQGSFNFDHPVFQKEGGKIHLLSTESEISGAPKGVSCHYDSLSNFLEYCEQELEIKVLLCEGGGELVRALAELRKLDEIHLTVAGHTLIGGAMAPGILGKETRHLQSSIQYELSYFESLGNGECFLSYQVL